MGHCRLVQYVSNFLRMTFNVPISAKLKVLCRSIVSPMVTDTIRQSAFLRQLFMVGRASFVAVSAVASMDFSPPPCSPFLGMFSHS